MSNKNREKNFVSAVVYVHNAEERIKTFVENLIDLLEENFEHSEIICVNDSSSDESLTKIKVASEKAKETTVSVINLSYFHGLEVAMNAGIDLSIGDFVYEFDTTVCDYDMVEVMNVYYKMLEGYDIVNASSNKKQRFSSSLFYKVFKRYTDQKYTMGTETFRILSRRVINRVSGMNAAMPYRKAVYSNSGLKAITYTYERVNQSEEICDRSENKYRSSLAIEALIIFTNFGYQFSKFLTGVMMFFAVFMAIYSIVVFCTSNPVSGWTTTILFVSFAFFGLFAILTLILKYLQVILNLVFKRKRYSFESIEKLTK